MANYHQNKLFSEGLLKKRRPKKQKLFQEKRAALLQNFEVSVLKA